MKVGIAALLCLFVVSVNAVASNDKPIEVSQLPQAAQQILKKDFGKMKVALAKMESGLFDGKGNWTELICKYSQVPVRLIPQAIKKYVNENYPSAKVIEMERDRSEYDVKLSTGLEITFNKKFQVTDIDN